MDHPRRCGENACHCGHTCGYQGSPPQVRGKQRCIQAVGYRQRITPAGAGKTGCTARMDYACTDHPRRCGENGERWTTVYRRIGSPPQVRGKLNGEPRPTSRARITPAGAGKTKIHNCERKPHWDHPRRCGENLPTAKGEWASTGSPPQVRGKLFRSFEFGQVPGSPPQVRGKRALSHMQTVSPRITPAGAGKTKQRFADNVRSADHPRRCGENPVGNTPASALKGSPPQVRGKRKQYLGQKNEPRITPAGAGKTRHRRNHG